MHAGWDPFQYLETEPTARRFLAEAYADAGLENPERLAYQQSHRFLYTLIQARACYTEAAESSLLIQPLLLYYGCVNLLKALLITRQPDYPQNSRELQHGVTTRKIKKTTYQLLEDEVRPQKEGLFARLVGCLHLRPLCSRYTLAQLFAVMPELAADYARIAGSSRWQTIQSCSVPDGRQLLFHRLEEGPLAYSNETLLSYLNRLAPAGVRFVQAEETPTADNQTKADSRVITVREEKGTDLRQHPLFARHSADCFLFWNGSADEPPLPAWAAHYLLLYVLSMLCRYETEWWGELVLSRTMAEVYLVERLLKLHQQRFPSYIYEWLAGQDSYFLQAPSL